MGYPVGSGRRRRYNPSVGGSKRTQKRWNSVCGWLLRSRRLARRTRTMAPFRKPPRTPIQLPQYDPDGSRVAELERAKRRYRLVRIAEKLALPVAWNHRTVQKLPSSERYTFAILWPKVCLVAALGKKLFLPGEPEERWDSLDELEEAYTQLGFPRVRDQWRDDLEFARLRVRGPNPVWLRGDWTPLSLVEAGLSEAVLDLLPPPDDPRWRNLYAVDYHEPLLDAKPTAGRYLYPCIALFEEVEGVLEPLGIQLLLDDGPVWRPREDTPAWQLAKVFFGSADIFVHEVISHWLWTHVVAEKFIIRTARTLSWRHPIRRLMAPHLTTTLAMNSNATAILVGNGGTFDTTFAGAAIKARLVEYGDAAWTYDHMVHPRRRGQLGIDRLAYHPYRDDGQRVWDAIAEYVEVYLEAIYQDDAELAADPEIQAWWDELHTALGNQGFPDRRDLTTLHELLTAVLFNPIHHALVNTLQFEVFGWPPLSPPTVPVPMPANPGDVTEQTLIDALPSVAVTLDTIRSTYGFSAQYDSYGAHVDLFHQGATRVIVARFRAKLREVAQEINAANSRRGHAYDVARPDLIGNSIDA